MNIGMVVYSHYSRDARVRRYAESLSRNDHKIDVISLKENYQPKERNISLLKFPLERRRLSRLWYLLEYFLFFIYSASILSFRFILKRYQIIHIHNMPEVLVFSAIIPKLFGAKIILDMHDPMPELYMSKYHVPENNLIVTWLKWLERLCFRFSDRIVTANEVFKSLFLKRNNVSEKTIDVILNCPDPKIFKNLKSPKGHPIRNSKFTLLYMGTVDTRFGLDIVVDSLPKLVKKIPSLRFIIIPKIENEGEYAKNLESRIRNSELKKYIKIFHPQPLEKIAEILRQADIGIVLAKNGIFTEMIFPVKLLEFIQMNVPVVATRTKILNRYFDNEMIYYLNNNNADSFYNAICKLYKYDKLRQSLANNAKNYFKNYNWQKEEKKYLDLTNKLFTVKS